jgi:hypothetical protein
MKRMIAVMLKAVAEAIASNQVEEIYYVFCIASF